MVTISFPNWSDALAAADLPDKVRGRHRIIINWFLGHLKRKHTAASKESARQFIEHLVETRQPAEWSRKRLRLTRSCIRQLLCSTFTSYSLN